MALPPLEEHQLAFYNSALLELGERMLTETEDREPRRVLDHIWNTGAVKYCLEQGQWKFAMRTVRLEFDPAISPEFGFRYAFPKPDDYVRTAGISGNEYFRPPMDDTDYNDADGGKWYANLSQIYVRYVSNSEEYGLDYSRWPETFKRYFEGYLALRYVKRLTNGDEKALQQEKKVIRLLADARSKDALNGGTGKPGGGSWNSARNNGGKIERTGGSLYG